jgi:heat-inducible transcriptional repressor
VAVKAKKKQSGFEAFEFPIAWSYIGRMNKPNVPNLTNSGLMSAASSLDQRTRDIFRTIVESYLNEGEPLGSRNLARILPVSLSPATIRNVMSDLEALGLIYAPHVSAGRLPTQLGLRFFVDGFMEVGGLASDERKLIDSKMKASGDGRPFDQVLTEASELLSGLSRGAGLVLATKQETALKHIEFVRLDPLKALVILVSQSGEVENRVIELPSGITASQLIEASNFLNAHIAGRTIGEARTEIARLLRETRQALDTISTGLVEKGLAIWSGSATGDPAHLIVRGRANLLDGVNQAEDLERLKLLFDDLETKQGLLQLLDMAETGSGVRIFIGSENRLFSLSGSSVVVAPLRDTNERIVGAVGVIGPTRLNYGRIVPMVDYTAQLISKLVR